VTRETYVLRNGELVPKRLAGPREDGRVQGVISDDLGSDLEHMDYADGRRTASKSTYRRWTREAGSVEKGNDRVRSDRNFGDSDTRQLQRDVAQAIEMVKQGYRPRIPWREDG
jgi:hypothetical protein